MIERRASAAGLAVAIVAAVVAPVVQNFRIKPHDSFPLSHYPMFSAARGEVVEVTHLDGCTSGGERVVLRCSLLGPGGTNQHRKQIRRIANRRHPERTTDRVARRVGKQTGYANVVSVRLVTCSDRLADWFGGRLVPHSEIVHAVSTIHR